VTGVQTCALPIYLLLFPILFAVGGAATNTAIAFIYNTLAVIVGGIKVDLADVKE